VARFYGRYEHSLDVKGRVILPAEFRGTLGIQAYVSQFEDGCLALWTSEEFGSQMDLLLANQHKSKADMNRARIMSSNSKLIEVDGQGRVAIPVHLREFARLQSPGTVLIIGAIERIEFWDPQAWEQRIVPYESQLDDAITGAP
jgi:MraZ protein